MHPHSTKTQRTRPPRHLHHPHHDHDLHDDHRHLHHDSDPIRRCHHQLDLSRSVGYSVLMALDVTEKLVGDTALVTAVPGTVFIILIHDMHRS